LSDGAGPLAGRVIFIEGAPRSGTTLLVSMLASHPEIAGTVAESHLFDRGVGALFDNYNRQAQFEGFLSNYVTEEQLTGLVRDLCDGVLGAMRERVKPEAERVVEKTPLPRFGAREVMDQKLDVYPDATYVHVVRDRDAVVRSLMRAPWADCDEAGAAQWWSEAVDSIRATAGAGQAHYIEIAYEELSADPVGAVSKLLGELGLEVGAEVKSRLEAASRERISSFGRPDAPSASAAQTKAVGGGRGQVAQAPRGPAARVSEAARDIGRRLRARGERNTRTAQLLIVAARRGDRDEVARLSHPDFHLELRTGVGDLVADGDRAREALLAVAGSMFRLQAVSEGWGGIASDETTASSLAIVYGDGSRTDISATSLVRNGVVERMQILAAGDPAGRTPLEFVIPEPEA